MCKVGCALDTVELRNDLECCAALSRRVHSSKLYGFGFGTAAWQMSCSPSQTLPLHQRKVPCSLNWRQIGESCHLQADGLSFRRSSLREYQSCIGGPWVKSRSSPSYCKTQRQAWWYLFGRVRYLLLRMGTVQSLAVLRLDIPSPRIDFWLGSVRVES